MRIATYNLNGVTARLGALLEWLEESRPDVVCLQEIGAAIADGVRGRMSQLGYVHSSGLAHILAGDVEHGVATFSRAPAAHQVVDLSLDGFLRKAIPGLASAVLLEDGEHWLSILNAHLVWGSRAAGSSPNRR